MKKSELRKLIREAIKEQMSINPPKPLGGKKNFPGSPGGVNPFGSMATDPPLGGVGGGSPDPVKTMYNSLGRPRTLSTLGQALVKTGASQREVNSVLRNAMRKYNIGPNEPINPSAIPIWVWYVGRAVLYGVGGYIITSEE